MAYYKAKSGIMNLAGVKKKHTGRVDTLRVVDRGDLFEAELDARLEKSLPVKRFATKKAFEAALKALEKPKKEEATEE